jgi:hypothetical protein
MIQKDDIVIYKESKLNPGHGYPLYVGVVQETDVWGSMCIVKFRNGASTDTVLPNRLKKITKEVADMLVFPVDILVFPADAKTGKV